jgi:hypothetical protein
MTTVRPSLISHIWLANEARLKAGLEVMLIYTGKVSADRSTSFAAAFGL